MGIISMKGRRQSGISGLFGRARSSGGNLKIYFTSPTETTDVFSECVRITRVRVFNVAKTWGSEAS